MGFTTACREITASTSGTLLQRVRERGQYVCEGLRTHVANPEAVVAGCEALLSFMPEGLGEFSPGREHIAHCQGIENVIFALNANRLNADAARACCAVIERMTRWGVLRVLSPFRLVWSVS